ncbi:flagellin [Desulfitibacter alkalitolerans]|uniref:flagellin N-terminal helical domain-containing protein n=1 Tax=Desulfitibacter alkalitolerans TaxID=264641 RepID=UPI000487DFCD|nr:flagellin [Desulfitibacter alkalitolerans]
MRINNNLMAMNTHRQLGITNSSGAKAMEKLSSGFRINRAGDDAAGLAISEKMRGQIRGLNQASRNAQDGISLIQTAEGALNETHAILQRMRELAVQSATDTNTADDRTKLQAEVDQLAKEITRISNTTEFNTKNLLAGGLNNTFHIGANQGQSVGLTIGAMDAKTLGVAGNIVNTTVTYGSELGTNFSVTTNSEGLNGYFVNIAKVAATQAVAVTGGTANTTATAGGSYTGSSDVTLNIRVTASDGTKVTAAEYSIDGGNTWTNAGAMLDSSGANSVFTYQGATITMTSHADVSTSIPGLQYNATLTSQYFNVQLGSTDTGGTVGTAAKMYNNQSSVVVGDASTDRIATVSLGGATTYATAFAAVGATGTTYTANSSAAIAQTQTASTSAIIAADGTVSQEAVAHKGLNISTQGSANLAITTINNALETVSAERSKLGAAQNRLDHTIKNLDTSSENLQASESRIRDVDMAKEMMEFTKQNILQQAATAMLAQANQAPQAVLQLLR